MRDKLPKNVLLLSLEALLCLPLTLNQEVLGLRLCPIGKALTLLVTPPALQEPKPPRMLRWTHSFCIPGVKTFQTTAYLA